jgi:hypothetical protein
VRVFLIFLVIDFLGMVYVTRGVYGDMTNGYEWPQVGHVMFPIPFEYPTMTPVTQPLSPIETFIFLVFISNSVWMFWTSLAIIYIVMPLLLQVRNRKSKL